MAAVDTDVAFGHRMGSEHLEIFALLPLRNFGLEARDLGVLDRQEVVDEAGAQVFAKEGVPAQR